jgi:hypothetical protein
MNVVKACDDVRCPMRNGRALKGSMEREGEQERPTWVPWLHTAGEEDRG